MAEQIILVYLVRHGETVANSKHEFRGNLDLSLNAKGRREAQALTFWFEPIDLSHVVCSTRRRAVETCTPIADSKGLPLQKVDNLQAWNIGEFSGKPKTDENTAELQKYIECPDLALPGGESLNDFRARVAPCFHEAVEMALKCGEPILLGVHSSVIHEAGDIFAGDHKAAVVLPGGVAAIFTDGQKLGIAAIFRPKRESGAARRADTIS